MVKWTFMMRVMASNQFMTAREARRQEARQMEKERRQLVAKEMKIFRPRKYEGKPNYLASTWGRLLFNARIRDPTDKKGGKLFRRRFRVPYPLFEHLVEMTRNSGWFSEAADCTGQMAAPLELKILAVLRVLGRGYCFDGVEELTLISAEVLRVFFRKWCTLFCQENFSKYCNHPKSEEEIAETVSIYTKLGLPGCVGSTDCVHIRWERCPAGQRSFHKGKEGYPTLSYEVTVDHRKKIIAATEGHPGCRNDKTIVKFDGFVTAIHDGEIYSEVPYSIVNEDGVVRTEKGLYLIVDGGYHKWKCLQCPMKHTSLPKDALWSKWVESVRKDVECVFGILKGRFRCLKLPIYYHDKATVDSMFFTCCILHNMLLSLDGYDRRWEADINWAGQAGDHDREDMATIFKNHSFRARAASPTADFSLQGIDAVINRYAIVHSEVEEELEATHETLRRNLIEHFCFLYRRKEIKWLK